MNFNIDPSVFEEIANEIKSDDSPVGIDAKKTHVIIIQKLQAIEERLRKIEEKLEDLDN
ncbi:MAG: hypothetical protein IPL46_21585 [Saprospiraceae bacterium]|nr:hypothetical protein [Saprospiraceae bacterium]